VAQAGQGVAAQRRLVLAELRAAIEQHAEVVVAQKTRHHEQHADIGMGEGIGELGSTPEGIDRHHNGAEAPRAESAAQEVGPIGHEDADARALADPQCRESRGDAARIGREVGEGQRLIVEDQGRLAAMRGGEGFESVTDGLHGATMPADVVSVRSQ
jgi:hypothetical protein